MRRLWIEDLSTLNTLPAVVMATIIGSQVSSLVSLSIQAPVVGLDGDGIAALVALTQLTYLEVRGGRVGSCDPAQVSSACVR